MLAGIALLNDGEVSAALCHFENALSLRLATSWENDSSSAWLVAAAWINRGDCLRALARSEEALDSYAHAMTAMAHVPLDENPGYHHRLLLACLNHATVCGELGRSADALAGFAHAETIVASHGTTATPAGRELAGMLHTHRATVLLESTQIIEGWRSACKSIEPPGPATGDAAIKARAVYCRALAMLLDEPDCEAFENDWIATATDTVEETLTLARQCGYRADWIADLVRYGARIYRACQPHFLGEFVAEWCTEDPALRRFGLGEIALAKRDLELRLRRTSGHAAPIAGHLDILRSLQLAERQISTYSAAPA